MPEPRRGEKRSDFVSRCIPVVIAEGTTEDGSQAAAICHGIFDRRRSNEAIANTENEHECRLASPGRFQDGSFRRTTRRSGGKTYHIIMGKLKDEDSMTEQAYRYKRDEWETGEARSHCREHDGNFTPATGEGPVTQQVLDLAKVTFTMKANCYTYRVDKANVRREFHEGRVHLVAPVVMMVEGVHCGSMGPSLYLAEEFSKTPGMWNGVPLPVYHPQEDGTYVSANDPRIIEQRSVGRLYNVHFDPEEKKLRGEIWVDIERAMRVDSTLVPRIEQGRPLDISTAHWSDDEVTTGVWHDEEYIAIVRNIKPDHLALLPGEQGACSWDDGCGVRANSDKEGGDAMEFTYLEEVREALQDEEKVKDQGFLRGLFAKLGKKLGLKVQELSHDELRAKLQGIVDQMDRPPEPQPGVMHFVKQVFDDFFIYEAHREGEQPRLFKQTFVLDDQNNVSLRGRPEEVIEETNYVAATTGEQFVPVANDGGGVEPQDQQQVKEVDSMERTEAVNALITCEQNQWCEDDREFLMSLADDKFAKIEALAAIKETPKVEEPVVEEPAVEEPVQVQAEEPVVEEPVIEEPVKVQKLEDLIANADPELRESIEQGQRMLRDKKNKLVQGIMANKRNKFSEEQLRGKPMDELETLAELAQVQVDFSPKGGGKVEDKAAAPPAPRMKWNKDGTPNYDHLEAQ